MSMKIEYGQMASYILFKDLYDNGKKDVYYILSRFIEDIIVEKKLSFFTLTQMSSEINSCYGFSIPDFVIQTSIRGLKYIEKQNQEYYVDLKNVPSVEETIKLKMYEQSIINNHLLDELIKFCESKKGTLCENEKQKFIESFYSLLLESNITNEYVELVSAFIIDKSTDVEITNQIMSIKQGVVLYAGLNYNSSVLPKSKWNDELYIFVEMEILFHLMGYNGVLFKELAEEVISLISEINAKSGKIIIHLRYFKDCETEIFNYFKNAEDIIEGKKKLNPDASAMKEILKGCVAPSDIIEKKQMFYELLRKLNIQCFEKEDYYTEDNYSYNLESNELIKSLQLEEDKQKYLTHLNYINILRKGSKQGDLSKSRFVILSETGKILWLSRQLNNDSKVVPLAISMSLLTNRLWYDLNKGFGSSKFPRNSDVLIKAKILLSNSISSSVVDKYEKLLKKYLSEEINEEQMAYTMGELRDEMKKPEDINKFVIDDVLERISEEDIERYTNIKQNLERDNEIKSEKIKIFESNLAVKEDLIQIKDNKIRDLDEKNKELLISKKSLFEEKKSNLQMLNIKKNDGIFRVKKNFKLLIFALLIVYYGILIFLNMDIENNNSLFYLLYTLPILTVLIITLIYEKSFNFLKCYTMILDKFIKLYNRRFLRKNKFSDDELQRVEDELELIDKELLEYHS